MIRTPCPRKVESQLILPKVKTWVALEEVKRRKILRILRVKIVISPQQLPEELLVLQLEANRCVAWSFCGSQRWYNRTWRFYRAVPILKPWKPRQEPCKTWQLVTGNLV
nr:unnamed protein product [Callosobruchus chinensis]